ncbi:MAG: hypothetical protein ACTSR5_10450 [Promethearchaeota archaeon]
MEPKKTSKLVEVIIFILFALGPLTGNVILVLFGVLYLEFSVVPSAILIAIPSFMFPFALVQLFSGAISDVKGRFPVILMGLSIFGIGYLSWNWFRFCQSCFNSSAYRYHSRT